MSLENDKINEIMSYCKRDLPQSYSWYLSEFDFIKDEDLKNELSKEFYSARYIYKLMEALNVSDFELHAHAKFQIIQYASIYEAVINYLLKEYLKDKVSVKNLYYHKVYKPIAALAAPTKIYYDDKEVFMCLHKDEKTPQSSVKFSDKVAIIVNFGIIEKEYGEDIKEFYKFRNSIHIETAVKRNTEYHIELSKKAYRRMRPFIDEIKEYIKKL